MFYIAKGNFGVWVILVCFALPRVILVCFALPWVIGVFCFAMGNFGVFYLAKGNFGVFCLAGDNCVLQQPFADLASKRYNVEKG